MGQRHQVMVITRNKDEDQKFYAFHNQWCYGTLPLRHLERLIRYQKKADEYTRLGEYQTDAVMIAALMGTDAKEGFYQRYSDVTGEHLDDENNIHPDWGDNNDGITVIVADPTSKKLSYCFMSIEIDSDQFKGHEPKAPMSARDYISCYYDPNDSGEEGAPKWKAWKIERLVSFIDKNARLLTVKELRELFPVYYAEELEREKIENASQEELPLLIHTDYDSNKALVEQRLKGVPV